MGLENINDDVVPVPLLREDASSSKVDEKFYKSFMPLYAISRARIQYIGGSIPLFRFRHALFEALISIIHERDIKPNSFYSDDRQTL